MPDTPLPGPADVQAAAQRLAGAALCTPVLRAAALDARVGAPVLIKAECLQRTGSFKFRGAYNLIAGLTPQSRARGVVAFSSGNHAIAVATAAQMFAISATIVMPADAPSAKRDATARAGARIVLYDRVREDREAIARAIADETGAVIAPPFEHPDIIAGQGTAGLEFAAQAREMDVALDTVVACASGGGLVAGVTLGFAAAGGRQPRVYAAEPEGHDDLRRSLEAGVICANPPGVRSVCDALLVDRPGEIAFALNRTGLAGGLTVSDREVFTAMRVAFEDLKIVLEPGGAAALAAVLSGRIEPSGGGVGVIASGGNVDSAMFTGALMAG